jgi:hypothetical protein
LIRELAFRVTLAAVVAVADRVTESVTYADDLEALYDVAVAGSPTTASDLVPLKRAGLADRILLASERENPVGRKSDDCGKGQPTGNVSDVS